MEYPLLVLNNDLKNATDDYRIADEKLQYSKLYRKPNHVISAWELELKRLSDNITSLQRAISILKAENNSEAQNG